MPLVVVEGIDGAGKSTLVRGLASQLRQAHLTQEPTKDWTGEAVRRAIRDHGVPAASEMLLFMADHAQHVARLRPLLAKGTLVISDRWSTSTLAYQAVTLQREGLFPDWQGAQDYIARVLEPLEPRPDLCLLLDLDPRAGVRRKGALREKFEAADFLTEVRAAYRRAVERLPHRVLDASRPPDAVLAEAIEAVQGLAR